MYTQCIIHCIQFTIVVNFALSYLQVLHFRLYILFRIGDYYPELKSDFDQTADCPVFWRDKKIKINLLNMTNEDYIDNIQLLAYVGLGINVLVSIACFVIVWRYSQAGFQIDVFSSACDWLVLLRHQSYSP